MGFPVLDLSFMAEVRSTLQSNSTVTTWLVNIENILCCQAASTVFFCYKFEFLFQFALCGSAGKPFNCELDGTELLGFWGETNDYRAFLLQIVNLSAF